MLLSLLVDCSLLNFPLVVCHSLMIMPSTFSLCRHHQIAHNTIPDYPSKMAMATVWANPKTKADYQYPKLQLCWRHHHDSQWCLGLKEQAERICLGDHTWTPTSVERHRTFTRAKQWYLLQSCRSLQISGWTHLPALLHHLLQTPCLSRCWPQLLLWQHGSDHQCHSPSPPNNNTAKWHDQQWLQCLPGNQHPSDKVHPICTTIPTCPRPPGPKSKPPTHYFWTIQHWMWWPGQKVHASNTAIQYKTGQSSNSHLPTSPTNWQKNHLLQPNDSPPRCHFHTTISQISATEKTVDCKRNPQCSLEGIEHLSF